MIRAVLLLDCDTCKNLFIQPRLVSNDQQALIAYREKLLRLAESNGWSITDDRNHHFCESCAEDIEMMRLAIEN